MGPGTFRPVEVEQVEDHRVDPEPCTIPAEKGSATGVVFVPMLPMLCTRNP